MLGLVLAALTFVIGTLGRGLIENPLSARQRLRFSAWIWYSARNGILLASAFSLILVLILGGATAVSLALVGGTLSATTFGVDTSVYIMYASLGMFIGIFTWLFVFGGLTPLHQITLRWQMWRSGVAPVRYVQFLDFAADHILLQKVGGGYRFTHALLREYFAAQDRPTSDTA
jgi:hypothetical protein